MYFDTLEGEKKYNVDVGDSEPIEEVLRDILVELSEKGHTMKGLSTGDLKVVWGGRQGRELDLSRTLPEQGVQPNEVLRVLVEMYEGGGSLRDDRIQNEWRLLEQLARLNPGAVRAERHERSPGKDVFLVRLNESSGVESIDREGNPVIRHSHTLRFVFQRYYPDMPVEAYVDQPLFHPNIRPETGFVCLWESSSADYTIVQAVARARAMAAFRMVNLGTAHLMNRGAAQWYTQVGMPRQLVPLSWDELQVFEVRAGQLVWLEPARQMAHSAGGGRVGFRSA